MRKSILVFLVMSVIFSLTNCGVSDKSKFKKLKNYRMKNIIIIFILMGSIFSCSKPYKTIKRGSLTLEKYYKSGGIGGHAQWSWEIYINNKRFKIKETGVKKFDDCFTSPDKNTEVVFFRVFKGTQWYYLHVIENKIKLSKIDMLPYSWNIDGKFLIFKSEKQGNNKMLGVKSGLFSELPDFTGFFLCLSPHKSILVSRGESLTKDGISYSLIHQTEIKTGKLRTDTVKYSKKSKWLWDFANYKQHESTNNVWMAKHFKWIETAGNDSLNLSKFNLISSVIL